MDAHSEARLVDVHPTLAAKVRQLADLMQNEGCEIRVVQGLRTWEEQDALYAQGRDGQPGPIVTHARGGQSFHNVGLAVDVVPGLRGVTPWKANWDAQHHDYERMVAHGESLGLHSGSKFQSLPDWPHFQLNGNQPIGCPTAQVIAALKAEGLEAAWKLAGVAGA